MNVSNINISKTLTALLLLGISLNVACAPAMKAPASKANSLTQSYVWYDGDKERKVWVNPQVMADFNTGATKRNTLQIGSAAASPQQPGKYNGVRLWKLDSTAASASSSALQSLKESQPSGKYSPVFHDGPSNMAGIRALPGNIIVYLNPAWDSAAVADWLKARKFEVVKKLEIGPNIYLLKTGSGMDALDSANNLYKSGEVKAAFPDWWQEVAAQ